MAENKRRNLQSIDKEIKECKKQIHRYESHVITNASPFVTPSKSNSNANNTSNAQKNTSYTANNVSDISTNSIEQSRKKEESAVSNGQGISKYVEYMNRLKDSLEQKLTCLQIQHEKQRLNYENKMQKLKVQAVDISALKSQLAALEKSNQQKTAKVSQLTQIVQAKNQENLVIKLENKTLKADNKVIMNHIDRLTLQAKNPEKTKSALAEREMRVMKSLYKDPPPSVESRQNQRRKEQMQEISTKIQLDDTKDNNSQLKYLIKKMNEEKSLLEKQKEYLAEDNRQKCINLENQKMLTEMSASEIQKLNGLIIKMGQKIISLEKANIILKEERAQKEDMNLEEQSYYQINRNKAGRFYYKK